MSAVPGTDGRNGHDGAHPDHAATERIRTALDETLFVEAGAGSGKTRALVDRVMALVLDAGEPLHAIAAITFTEKAAAELRDRIRHQLEVAGAAARRDGRAEVAARCVAALDDLDGAAIGTLHSFAQRILSEHPVEAGLPPRVEVLDEVASLVAFDDRWAELVDDLLDDEALARPILLLTAAGVRLTALREIALSFNQNWDLVAERASDEAPALPEWESRLAAIVDAVEQACNEQEHCSDDSDPLCCLLRELEQWVHQVRTAPDESARLALTRPEGGRPKASPNGKGAKPRWAKGYDLPALRAQLKDLMEQCDLLANEVTHAALQQVAVELRRFTLEAAEHRRRDGRLEFHDLLVMARQVLRDPEHGPAVRAALHDRYRRLLLDEFQDTDPIQVELAVLVASPDPDAGGKPWQEIEPAPGRLFFVGDPKQSIYRFRRADIALFLRAAEHFGGGADGAGSGHRLSLTTNHRSGERLVAWINEAFGRLITPGPTPFSQPGFEPSVAVRPDAPEGPAVSVMGRTAHGDGPAADELRAREAADVATAVSRILQEGWQVDRSPDWRDPDWQPARAGDITILLPTRLSLPFLEDALTEAGHAYRVESASLVYGGRLVRDVFLTLRAIDDPSDELAVVAALRSALFGCGDDDLFLYREAGGSFDHTVPPPETVPEDSPVRAGLAYLGEMHRQRRWRTPSEMVDRVVRDRRVLELGGNEGRARDLWQRMRFVVDQARAWTDTSHGTLRQYLDWVRQQSSPGSRVAEAVLPETDDDAVRIMTVHAAKGLQFPITIVAGLSTQPQARLAGAQVVWPPDGSCLLNVGKKVTSPAFEAWRPLDEQMSHDERIRLLYVACTRARDHLVLSLHRRTRSQAPASPARLTNAELLVDALGDDLDQLPDATVGASLPLVEPAPAIEVAPPAAAELPPFEVWRAERESALAAGARPRTVAATALTEEGEPDADSDPGLRKRPGDLDLPPWRKGRYGTAVGRAVHGVLQLIDLATGAGLDELVAAQAAAEGVTGHEGRVATLVRAALDAPTVAEAAANPHWREVYVGVPLGGDQTLEGYVDLLYRRPDGRLVVVDYKTGPESPDDPLDELVERYRLQGSSYALAVGEATGEPVDDVVFLFLTPDGAVARHLDDLPSAVATTRTLIESHRFTLTD
ncbi:MAG TPA: UvrD-helicase domain-containing protein [Acidimicrobiales bacterium]